VYCPRDGASQLRSHTVTDSPADLLERLWPVLAAQGSPRVTARQEGLTFVFQGGASEFVLKARGADALTTAWPAAQAVASRWPAECFSP